jgi:hypothetical protein
VGQTHRVAKEEKVRSTVVKPSNGQAKKNKPRNPGKTRSPGLSLRRLTKRQKEKIYRIFAMVFIVVFTLTIVGSLVAVSVRIPTGR